VARLMDERFMGDGSAAHHFLSLAAADLLERDDDVPHSRKARAGSAAGEADAGGVCPLLRSGL
jgi:hypothetical protein